MTNQQDGTGPDNPVANLQPLNFLKKSDNRSQAVYQAEINNADAAYTLTVTAASPGDDQQAQNIKEFLADMVVRFELTTPITLGDPGPIQSFDVKTGILIEPDLVKAPSGPGPFGITMTLQTTVGPDSSGSLAGPFAIRGIVLGGKSHTYRARHGRATATVTALQGSGWISSPDKNIYAGGASQSDRGSTVTVHGYDRCVYNLVGDFY
jgi:hypothetical protein